MWVRVQQDLLCFFKHTRKLISETPEISWYILYICIHVYPMCKTGVSKQLQKEIMHHFQFFQNIIQRCIIISSATFTLLSIQTESEWQATFDATMQWVFLLYWTKQIETILHPLLFVASAYISDSPVWKGPWLEEVLIKWQHRRLQSILLWRSKYNLSV